MSEELQEYEEKMREYYPCMDIECEYAEDNMSIYSDVCIPGIDTGEFFMFANITLDGYFYLVLGYEKIVETVDFDVLKAVNEFNMSQAFFTAYVSETGELNFVHYTSILDVEDCMDKFQDLMDFMEDDDMCIPFLKPLLSFATLEIEDEECIE